MSSWGNNDNAANAPYWAVSTVINHNATSASAPTAANVALLYGNTQFQAYTQDTTVGLFMVDSAEVHAGGDKITDISIINGGTGYLEVPYVNITGGGGSGAQATATISGGKVIDIQVTNTGSSYETVPTVNVNIPYRTIATTSVTTASNTISYTAHGISTGQRMRYYKVNDPAMGGLANATTYYAIKVNNNTLKLATSAANAANTVEIDITGTGNNAQYFDKADQTTATAIADKGLGQGGGSDSGWTHTPHTGWNLKKVGTGGRAGRVQWETLSVVADVQSDGSDDITLPDA